MAECETVYGVERAKFKGFGEYKIPIENRVNEILELTKKEYPNVDNYLLWLCAVDYVLDEMGLKKTVMRVRNCMKNI